MLLMADLHCDFSCNMRMWVIVDQLEILELEVKDILYIRVDSHLRQFPRFTGQLELYLFQMVEIDVCIS